MSNRADKKRRKEYRQLYAREMRDPVAETKKAQEQAEFFRSLIKPKPRWMPTFVYWWCVRTIIK